MSDIKKINIVPEKKEEKQSKKRAVTNSTEWIEHKNNFSKEEQLQYLSNIYNKQNDNTDICKLIHKQINKKISGYKNQDKLKKLYNSAEFIEKENVITLLYESELKCYYCNEQTNLLYDTTRDDNQWSLDRLENDIGHNKGNLVICCLSCNVKRKTMYHGRFLFTKQLGNIKKV